jgi:hypothetical protein
MSVEQKPGGQDKGLRTLTVCYTHHDASNGVDHFVRKEFLVSYEVPAEMVGELPFSVGVDEFIDVVTRDGSIRIATAHDLDNDAQYAILSEVTDECRERFSRLMSEARRDANNIIVDAEDIARRLAR